jgi:hypothetical protein
MYFIGLLLNILSFCSLVAVKIIIFFIVLLSICIFFCFLGLNWFVVLLSGSEIFHDLSELFYTPLPQFDLFIK